MGKSLVYEGTLEELTKRYGKELRGRRLRVVVDETTTDSGEAHAEPFYENASPDEWSNSLREWASSHDTNSLPLSDWAVDRDSIYEGRGE